MRLLVRHGLVVNASGVQRADLLADNGRVARLAATIDEPADRVVDASGLLVLPGGVDPHVHLEMTAGAHTTADDIESGTRAAAFGGTTTVIDFAGPEPGQSLGQAVAEWRRRADGRAMIDYGLHVTVPRVNETLEAELDALVADGVTSFKLFMAYPGRLMLDDGAILRVMARASANGGLVMLHAENGHLIAHLSARALAEGRRAPREHARTRPPEAEVEAMARAVALAAAVHAPLYVVHVSTAGGAEVIAAARRRGARVTGETCPHYLLLTDREYERPVEDAAGFVMSPPLRPDGHAARLWRALADGDLQVVATDHCAFDRHGARSAVAAEDTAGEPPDFTRIPNGVPGIEHRLSLLYHEGVRTGRLSLPRFVEVTATAAARTFGLWPRKGALVPGADADLVLFDPGRTHTISAATHAMRVDNDPYEGREVTGAPVLVVSRGEVIVEDGRLVGRAGRGRFLAREPVAGLRSPDHDGRPHADEPGGRV